MTPYSASDIVRSMRLTYGLPEIQIQESDRPSRLQRWLRRLVHRG